MTTEQSPQDPPMPTPETPKQPPKKRGTALLWFWTFTTFAVAIVALVLVLFSWSRSNRGADLSTINQQTLQATKTTVATLSNQMNTLQSTQAKETQTLTRARKAVEFLVADVTKDQSLWQLADTAHLLQIAVYTLNFGHNVKTTIALLETADGRLSDLTDPQILPLRKLIAKEIVTLQNTPHVDVMGIYLRLDALNTAIQQLPINKNRFKNNEPNNYIKQKAPTKPGTFSHGLWHAFSKIVVIRHHQQKIEPILSTQQHFFLAQNIHLLFSQAQWALLHRQQAVYQKSLQKIQQLLGTYYVDGNNVKAYLSAIKKLQSKNIAPTLPDIGQALKATKALEKTKSNSTLTRLSRQKRERTPAKKTGTVK
jgi:uroporphyrin-III C-methyltransferase